MKQITFEDIEKWEYGAGESLFDQHENIIGYAYYLGYTLAAYPEHYNKIKEVFDDGVQTLVDLLAFDYDNEDNIVEMQDNIIYKIFLEIVNKSELHNQRCWAALADVEFPEDEEENEDDLILG